MKFNFGVYLSKYIMYERDGEKEAPFPEIYTQFMKKHAGIDWKIV